MAAALAEARPRLEGAFHGEIEQRPDQVVVLLEKRDRSTVAEARIDHAIDGMESVAPTKNVEHASANRQTHDVLVLNERTERQRNVERADDLGQEIVLCEVIILDVHTPGEGRPRHIMAQFAESPAIVIAADRTMHAGQRILDRGPFEAGVKVELGSLEADRVEQNGAGRFSPRLDGAWEIANALLAGSNRDDVDDVGHPIVMEIEPRLAPAAEIVGQFGFYLPALGRDELRITGILSVLAQHWLRQEIEEVDLAHAAAKLQANVPVLGWSPGKRHTALGPEELARRLIVVDPVEL